MRPTQLNSLLKRLWWTEQKVERLLCESREVGALPTVHPILISGSRIKAITPDFQSGDKGSIPFYRSKHQSHSGLLHLTSNQESSWVRIPPDAPIQCLTQKSFLKKELS